MSSPAAPARAVAFDFNGTLCDDEELLFEIFAEVFHENLGWRLERSEYFGPLAGLSDPDIVRTVLREHAAVDPDEQQDGRQRTESLLAQRGQRYRRQVDQHLPVRAGTCALVRALHERGTALAVVTGAQRADVEHVLERAGIAECFAVVVAAEDVDAGKPAPEGYLRAADTLGCRPCEVVAVEDSVAGLRAATAAGMRCVALTGTYDRAMLAAEGATVVDALEPALLSAL